MSVDEVRCWFSDSCSAKDLLYYSMRWGDGAVYAESSKDYTRGGRRNIRSFLWDDICLFFLKNRFNRHGIPEGGRYYHVWWWSSMNGVRCTVITPLSEKEFEVMKYYVGIPPFTRQILVPNLQSLWSAAENCDHFDHAWMQSEKDGVRVAISLLLVHTKPRQHIAWHFHSHCHDRYMMHASFYVAIPSACQESKCRPTSACLWEHSKNFDCFFLDVFWNLFKVSRAGFRAVEKSSPRSVWTEQWACPMPTQTESQWQLSWCILYLFFPLDVLGRQTPASVEGPKIDVSDFDESFPNIFCVCLLSYIDRWSRQDSGR